MTPINPTPTEIKIKFTTLRVDISGIATHYKDKIWVEDDNEEEGGSFQEITKKYGSPKMILNFYGETDVDLNVKSIYMDQIGNAYAALTKRQIRNTSEHVNKFSIPTTLIEVSRAHAG